MRRKGATREMGGRDGMLEKGGDEEKRGKGVKQKRWDARNEDEKSEKV